MEHNVVLLLLPVMTVVNGMTIINIGSMLDDPDCDTLYDMGNNRCNINPDVYLSVVSIFLFLINFLNYLHVKFM